MIAVLSSALKRLGTWVSVPASACSPCMSSEGKYALTHLLSKYWMHLIHRVQASLILHHRNQTCNSKIIQMQQCLLLFGQLSLHAASVHWKDHYVCHPGHLYHEHTRAVCHKFAQTPRLLWYIWRCLHCFLRCKGAVVSLYKRCESSSAWPGWTESAPLHRIHWPSTWLTRIAWQVHTCLTMAFALILNGYASILLYVVLIW